MYDETMVPEVESCINGLIPERNEPLKIKIAVGLATAPKLFFDANRQMLFRYLNDARRSGRLRREVGFDFTNKTINKSVCEFTGWDFWRIDQKNFSTDVFATLTLDTKDGPREWKGYLEVWCSFENEFSCSVEDFGGQDDPPDHSEDIRLSPFLVPYLYGYELDKCCERIWSDNTPEAIMDPKARTIRQRIARFLYAIQTNGITSPSQISFSTVEMYCTTLQEQGENQTNRYIYAASDILLHLANMGLCAHTKMI